MSHVISLADAAEMTALYRADKTGILAQGVSADVLPICETFERADIDDLLAQTGCEKVRIYYGMDENNKIHAILCGVNSDDEDMLSKTTGVILEKSRRCPQFCPPSSDLNS